MEEKIKLIKVKTRKFHFKKIDITCNDDDLIIYNREEIESMFVVCDTIILSPGDTYFFCKTLGHQPHFKFTVKEQMKMYLDEDHDGSIIPVLKLNEDEFILIKTESESIEGVSKENISRYISSLKDYVVKPQRIIINNKQ